MVTLNALPPDPEIVGEGWRDMWHERLKNIVLLPELWLGHPHRDEYWQQGSVCEDYSRIGCPVYAIGGWADGYSNAVPRLLAGLSVPRKGLVGPWSHNFPHNGVPGPAIGFLQEALRWWDHWLKDIDTGVMDEPMYRVWMQDSAPARSAYDVRPGRWVAEQSWPSPRIVPTCWYLSARQTLEQHPDEPACEAEAPRFDLQSPQNTGLCSGEWCGYGSEGEAPIDQREDDGKSLCFDTPALQAPVALLGAPTLELELSCDAPVAMLAVRLNDLSPDGASTRVSYGLLNLTHRDGHESPEAMIPGDRYRVTVRLNDVAHRFVRGHVIRLAVSSAYWPIAWPAPGRVTISVYPGASRLLLPVRPASEIDDRLARFGPPECARIPEATQLRPAQLKRTYERDLTSSDTVYIQRLQRWRRLRRSRHLARTRHRPRHRTHGPAPLLYRRVGSAHRARRDRSDDSAAQGGVADPRRVARGYVVHAGFIHDPGLCRGARGRRVRIHPSLGLDPGARARLSRTGLAPGRRKSPLVPP